MLTKRFKISCSEITARINEIKTKKVEFDGVVKIDIPKALELKKELQTFIQQTKEHIVPFVNIEGKDHPVFSLEIGGKTADELEDELLSKDIKINDYTNELLHSPDFTTLPNSEKIKLVRLKVSDLGLPNKATTDEIYARAQELGLKLCPAEVGPYQRLKDIDQPINNNYRIAMKQITDRYGDSIVFGFDHYVDGSVLSTHIARPRRMWAAKDEFVFCIPNK